MDSALRRYFDGLLLLLLGTGFATLASTGRLGWPVVLAACAAFGLRGYCFFRRLHWRIPARWIAVAALLYLPVYWLDGFFLPSGFVGATLRFAALVGAVQLFSLDAATGRSSGRNDLFLGVLAFLEVLAAALLTVSGLFFALFLLFLVLLVATLVAHEMAQAQAAADSPRATTSTLPALPLLRFSLWLSLGVAGCSVLIFFLLPRTTLGAWAGRRSATGLSGFSDEVRLGEIADLQRTDTPVMHIRFTSTGLGAGGDAAGPTPALLQQIPWRGRGLTDFDGHRWYSPDAPAIYSTQMGRLEVGAPAPRAAEDIDRGILRYQVTLEPMEGPEGEMASPVLFFPGRLLLAVTHFPALAWDRATGTLSSLGAGGFDATSYAGVSDLSRPSSTALRAAPALGAGRLRFGLRPFLQLPDNLDPRIRALARSVTATTPPDNWDRMQALTHYLQSHYQYTLDDLPQGSDPLAAFLFQQRAGDCEYFASALAVMARSLSIPTRVVNGFVLGSYNPLSGEYIVRGRDAHSWVEAYFPAPTMPSAAGLPRRGLGSGNWITFDATPAGADPAASAWPDVNLVFDALSSFWQEWIVNYDWMHQARLARGLQSGLGSGAGHLWANAWQSGGAALAAALAAVKSSLTAFGLARRQNPRGAAAWGLLLLVPLAVLAWAARRGRRAGWSWRAGHASPEERAHRRAQLAYRRFQACLRRAGCPRAPAHTAPDLLAAVAAAHGASAFTASAAAFVATYDAVRFGGAAALPLARQLEPALERVRRSAPRRLAKVPRGL